MKKNILKFTGERFIPKYNKNKAFYYEHFLRYNFATQFSKLKNVLDVACGTGYGCQLISKKGKALKITGVDISNKSIEFAKSNYQKNNIEYLVDDAQTLISQKNNSFDLITSFETIEHISNPEKFIKQTKRLLKENGILIISTPNTTTYPKGNKYHIKEQTPTEFYSLLNKYYKYTEKYYQKFYLSNLISKKEEIVLTNTDELKVDETNCEYLICVCSDQKIPIVNGVINNLNKVEQINLDKGYISLSKQFSEIYQTTDKTKNEKEQLTKDLDKIKNEKEQLTKDINKIQSSKTYKIWQKFCYIRKKLLTFLKTNETN